MNNEKNVIAFIDKLYKNLYLDEKVIHHGTGNKYDKFENIDAYLSRLESVHDKVSETGRHKEYLKKLYYDRYVIKEEDIPNSYYERQKQIALERGFGHVEISDEEKRLLGEEVINNQKRSMDVWLDYFMSNDSSVYPFWAKYWAFQGMLQMGLYNKETKEFGRRTKDTVSPFVDLNREALATSIDLVIRMIKKEDIGDKELEALVKSGSFRKIYSFVLTKVLSDNKNIVKNNSGKWIKYDRGGDHMPLVNSLRGYNTGWCTAGESTAKSQLSMGDFYVYYTLDENNEYKVPRVAIRMEGNEIGEIRGIAKDQNIESDMEMIVEEKLKEFPDRDKYYKKVNDMKMLTLIYNKHKNKEELTKEELKFLYEIENEIISFGYDIDPRIKEIKRSRNIKYDLSCVFDCTQEQVALSEEELTKDTICLYASLYKYNNLNKYNKVRNVDELVLAKYIKGSLYLPWLRSAEGLLLPEYIGEDLRLSSLTSAVGLKLPKSIGRDLYLSSLTSAEGLKLPQSIGGYLYLSSLRSAEGLELPQIIKYGLDLSSLISAKELKLPKIIEGNLELTSLISAEGLELPQNMEGKLDLSSLKSAKGLVLPKSVGGSLYLRELTSANGLILPESVGGDLYLSSLKSAKGLVLPKSVGGSLYLKELTSAEGLILPESIGDGLYLSNLTSAEGLKLPRIIEGDLDLSGLTSTEGLILPESIEGNLYLNNLTNAEGFVFPQSIGLFGHGILQIRSIGVEEINNLNIPDNINYSIMFKNAVVSYRDIDQYKSEKKII